MAKPKVVNVALQKRITKFLNVWGDVIKNNRASFPTTYNLTIDTPKQYFEKWMEAKNNLVKQIENAKKIAKKEDRKVKPPSNKKLTEKQSLYNRAINIGWTDTYNNSTIYSLKRYIENNLDSSLKTKRKEELENLRDHSKDEVSDRKSEIKSVLSKVLSTRNQRVRPSKDIKPKKKLKDKAFIDQFDGEEYRDVYKYLNDLTPSFINIIKSRLLITSGLKFYINISVRMKKITTKPVQRLLHKVDKSEPEIVEEEEETIDIYKNSKNQTIVNPSEISDAVDNSIAQCLKAIEDFISKGSGWVVDKVLSSDLNIVKFSPITGASYIDLPPKIKNKKACINVKNDDNECFRWAILSALHPVDKNAERVSKYKQFKNTLDFTGISFPVKADHNIKKFENLNKISINIYFLDDGCTVKPLVLTTGELQTHIDLLLIQDSKENNHYVWIKNFSALLNKQVTQKDHKMYYCKYCLSHFNSASQCFEHSQTKVCRLFDAVKTTLPVKDNAFMSFKDNSKLLPTPYFITADFEAILEPTLDVNTTKKEKKTEQHTAHTLCGFGYKVV